MYGTGLTNSNAGCNYARLGAYHAGFRGIRPPVPMTTVSGYYVVPSYSSSGYDTLTHLGHSRFDRRGGFEETNSASNYFSIGSAYGGGAETCTTQYIASLCG